MLYNIVLVSAIHQHASVKGIHMSPPPLTPLPPPSPSHPSRLSLWLELPESHSKFPLAIYFTHADVCFSMPLSPFIPRSPSHPVSTGQFSMSRIYIVLNHSFFIRKQKGSSLKNFQVQKYITLGPILWEM